MSRLVSLLLILLFPAVVGAGTLTVRNLFAAEYRDLTRDLAAALHFKQVAPAVPLGVRGFEVGVEVSATDIDDRADYWSLVTDDPPDYLVIPKVHLLKGLPGRVDAEAMVTFLPSADLFLWGLAAKWTWLAGHDAVPAASLRVSVTDLSGVDELDFTTVGADVAAGPSLPWADPYVGTGVVWVTSEAQVRAAEGDVLVTEAESFLSPHVFAGCRLYLPWVAITAELDWGERPTVSARVVFAR
jgi:hypothetical protein